jgi:hypothetical protein
VLHRRVVDGLPVTIDSVGVGRDDRAHLHVGRGDHVAADDQPSAAVAVGAHHERVGSDHRAGARNELDPRVVVILEDDRGGAGVGFGVQHLQVALVARLHHQRQAVGGPVAPWRGTGSARGPTPPRSARPPSSGHTWRVTSGFVVPAAGYRIAAGGCQGSAGLAMCHTGTRHVDAARGDRRPVRTPPVAALPVHLLGGDEVGAAPRDRVRITRLGDDRARRAVELGHAQLAAAHVRDATAERVGPRIEHRARHRDLACAPGHEPGAEQAAGERERSDRHGLVGRERRDAARPSRARSRRARSSGWQVVGQRPASSSTGSTTRSSRPMPTSATQRQFTGSEPPRLRANTTRRPSGLTTRSRGSPSVKRCVRAYWRGNVSGDSDAMTASNTSATLGNNPDAQFTHRSPRRLRRGSKCTYAGRVSLLAAVPIVAILVLMVGFGWSAVRAGLVALAGTLVIAVGAFDFGRAGDAFTTPQGLLGVAAEAAFIAGTVIAIIAPALAIHHLQQRTGATTVLQHALARLTPDPRVAALLIAWFFTLFIEGAAGFGTPIALAAPFLVAAGLPAARRGGGSAVRACRRRVVRSGRHARVSDHRCHRLHGARDRTGDRALPPGARMDPAGCGGADDRTCAPGGRPAVAMGRSRRCHVLRPVLPDRSLPRPRAPDARRCARRRRRVHRGRREPSSTAGRDHDLPVASGAITQPTERWQPTERCRWCVRVRRTCARAAGVDHASDRSGQACAHRRGDLVDVVRRVLRERAAALPPRCHPADRVRQSVP